MTDRSAASTATDGDSIEIRLTPAELAWLWQSLKILGLAPQAPECQSIAQKLGPHLFSQGGSGLEPCDSQGSSAKKAQDGNAGNGGSSAKKAQDGNAGNGGSSAKKAQDGNAGNSGSSAKKARGGKGQSGKKSKKSDARGARARPLKSPSDSRGQPSQRGIGPEALGATRGAGETEELEDEPGKGGGEGDELGSDERGGRPEGEGGGGSRGDGVECRGGPSQGAEEVRLLAGNRRGEEEQGQKAHHAKQVTPVEGTGRCEVAPGEASQAEGPITRARSKRPRPQVDAHSLVTEKRPRLGDAADGRGVDSRGQYSIVRNGEATAEEHPLEEAAERLLAGLITIAQDSVVEDVRKSTVVSNVHSVLQSISSTLDTPSPSDVDQQFKFRAVVNRVQAAEKSQAVAELAYWANVIQFAFEFDRSAHSAGVAPGERTTWASIKP